MRLLREFTTALRPDFWLMGEVVHGDYRRWVNPRTLHSVTNYECYKGLSSSLADRNYFEIAYALNRQFAPTGMYSDLALYNFVDNHDVNRVASTLENPAHLYPLYLLLFTMPGIPSIYYGSEWGLEGKRTSESDAALRPALDLDALQASSSHPNLVEDISKLASVRKALPALRQGSYAQLFVSHQQFAFARETENEYVVVALNASDSPVSLEINLPRQYRHAIDILNGEETFQIEQNTLRIKTIYPYWGRVFKLA